METTFEFENSNSEYTYNVNSNINLHIKRINNGVAILYFTDEMNNKVNVPNDILVYTYDNTNNERVILNPMRQYYALCWTDNYEIELNKNILINIKNQRKWKITS
jgi:hypothetical protein